MNTIRIKYLPGSPQLVKLEQGDWIDLYTYQDEEVVADEYKMINLGVAMELPAGYEAIVAPRSSTFKRWGLIQTNSIGVIDNSFSSDTDIWHLPVYGTRHVHIPKGTRLCQFRIQKQQPAITFEEVEYLHNKARGGFGSTGV